LRQKLAIAGEKKIRQVFDSDYLLDELYRLFDDNQPDKKVLR